jgi:dimethylglycine catabolism A
MPQYISDSRGPFGRNAAATAAIRAAVRVARFDSPVVWTGGVHNFEMAERLPPEGVCDIVGTARQSLTNPGMFRKFALDRGREVRLCEFTNYCEGLDQKPVAGQARPKDADGKRRLMAPDWLP